MGVSGDKVPPLVVQRTAEGWATPKIYLNLRKLGLDGGTAAEALRALLEPEMARICGVPENCVAMHCTQSWVDPHGRLVFHLTAHRPRIAPVKVEEEPVIDITPHHPPRALRAGAE